MPYIAHVPCLLMLLTLAGLWGCTGLEHGDRTVRAPLAEPPAALSLSPATGPARAPVDYRLPGRLSLCGEPLDLTKRSVYERLEYEFLHIVHHPAQVELWRRRARRYFPVIEARLRAAGLPDDLKYLAVAESDLRPWAASPAGALGLWQFMPGTARQFGLTVNARVDQRQLPEELLTAGVRYLASLRAKFGSWALAMAAYNCGDARLARALAGQGGRDYYQLDLPRETERYVYRIAAVKAVLEQPAAYGLTGRPPAGLYEPERFAEVSVSFDQPVAWPVLAERAGCDYKTLRRLNPHLLEASLSGGPYMLRVPKGAEARF